MPCGWQAMKNLDDVCDNRKSGPKKFIGTGTEIYVVYPPNFRILTHIQTPTAPKATIPTGSKNIDPSEVRQQNYFVSTTVSCHANIQKRLHVR